MLSRDALNVKASVDTHNNNNQEFTIHLILSFIHPIIPRKKKHFQYGKNRIVFKSFSYSLIN